MKFLKWIVAGALVGGLAAAGAAQRRGSVVAEKGGEDETGPYDVVPNWPQPLHTDRTWGRAAAIWPESPNRVFAIQTTELPVIERPENYDGGAPVRQTGRAQPQRSRMHRSTTTFFWSSIVTGSSSRIGRSTTTSSGDPIG